MALRSLFTPNSVPAPTVALAAVLARVFIVLLEAFLTTFLAADPNRALRIPRPTCLKKSELVPMGFVLSSHFLLIFGKVLTRRIDEVCVFFLLTHRSIRPSSLNGDCGKNDIARYP